MKLKKLFLYLTGFFCGMSVMAIELGASRLMAPYFSSSQVVYTIIIGTVMIAMALGNIIGGKMADKYAEPTKLFTWIFVAAIWTCLIPLVGKYIIAGVALILAASPLSSNFLVVAAFISCFLVFVFPLLIMGMVTPNLIKYAVGSLSESGKVVGTIEALNTIGSIIGTFIPTFVTIPFIGTSWTFIVYSLVLFVICLIYFFMKKKKRVLFTILAVFVIVISIIGTSFGSIAFWSEDTAYEGESIYNYIRVEKNDQHTILSTNVLFGVQSIKQNHDGLTNMYYDYDLAANVIADPGEDGKLDILILGLCTGTYAYQSNLYFDNCVFDGVEIDSKIVDLAYEYFDLADNVTVFIEDGRSYIDSCQKKYDIIMVDAYQDITIPFQMSSLEFFQSVKRCLEPNGVMVVNMNMYAANEGGINDYLCSTILNVFDYAYGAVCGSNFEVYASSGFDPQEKLLSLKDTIYNPELRYMMYVVSDKLTKIEKKDYLLTDDKAPVELLGMSILDDMIFSELEYYRNLIRGKSIPELLDMLAAGELF